VEEGTADEEQHWHPLNQYDNTDAARRRNLLPAVW